MFKLNILYAHILSYLLFGFNLQPLLIQCRLFHDGYAVKGTLLVNRKVIILHFKPLYVKFLVSEQNLLVYDYDSFCISYYGNQLISFEGT